MAAPKTPSAKSNGAGGGEGGGGGGGVASALKEALASLTVEPAFALYCVAETMSKFLYQAFLLDKYAFADRAREPPRSAMAGAADDEAAVKFVAFANSWLMTPAVFVTVVYTVLAISWSDRAGKRRRPLILAPLLGLALECASAALHAHYWRWPVGWLLATYALAQVVFGGRICFAQCVYLYVADVTTNANRTARYGLLMTVRFFAMPLGYAVAGLLLRLLGFFYAFLVAFALTVAATLLAWTLVADPPQSPAAAVCRRRRRRSVGFWRAVNPVDSVRSVRVLLKKRPQRGRLILATTLLAYSLFSFTNEGELSVMYLYLSRQFRWSESQIGAYLTYRMFVNGVGTLVCSVVLSKGLKMEDGSIGIFIAVAKTTAALAYALANADWQLYAVPLVDMYFAAGITVTRSFATKLVSSDELGRLAAVCSLTKVSIALCQPLYNTTYALTMNSLPSAFFCVSLFFAVVILSLIGFSQKLHRKRSIETTDHVLLS